MSTASTMTDAEFDAAVRAAIVELRAPKQTYEPDEEMTTAAHFIIQFGALGDVYDEPGLTQLQFAGPSGSGLNYLGHWSVQRNDGGKLPDPEFFQHQERCRVCNFFEGILGIVDMFSAAACESCKGGIEVHDVMPAENGDVICNCRPVWERQQPLVSPAGDVAEHQISDAFNARWALTLADGTYALVTRTYYIAHNTDDAVNTTGVGSAYDRKVPYVECQDEYLVCTDLTDPGGTEINSEIIYVEIESDDPLGEDPEYLALTATAPEPGEWDERGPQFAVDLLPAGA